MFAKSQKERTSSPLFPALPIVVAVSFSLTLQAFAQGSSQASSQAGTAATTNNRSAAATKATTAAATKPTVYEGDVKTGSGKGTTDKDAKAGTDAKAGDSTTKKKKKAKEVEIVKTRVFESTNAKKWQTFPSYIELKQGQETLPLVLTVDNGPDESTPMTAIRADLAGRRLFTEKNFAGKKTLKIDMSDALAPGPTQIVFSAFGAKGAKFSWKITSNASPNITKIEGESIIADKTARATGTLLPPESNLYTVKVGGVGSSVVSVSDNKSVEFRVPKDAKADAKGEVTVEFTISGQKIKPLKVKLAKPPEIKAFSHTAINISPERNIRPFTITGENFSDKASDIKVTFNGREGTVTSCSKTTITVVPPEIVDYPSVQTVQIEVNGMKAPKPGVIQVDVREAPNDEGTSPFEVGGAWR